MEGLPETSTSLVIVVMSGALMVNTMCVTSDGIAAEATAEPMISQNSLFALARIELFPMVMLALLPLSPTFMVTVDVPTFPVDEPPPPHPAVRAVRMSNKKIA